MTPLQFSMKKLLLPFIVSIVLISVRVPSLRAQEPIQPASDDEAARAAAAAANKPKNWHAPPGKILGQQLVDQLMAGHPELLSITLHGVPPGTRVHTMFAGSFPERIGNADDPDDIDASEKALTVLDPRLDRKGRFVVFIPMKDASGKRIGTIVIAFKTAVAAFKEEIEYYQAAIKIQDDLQMKTPSLASLFQSVK